MHLNCPSTVPHPLARQCRFNVEGDGGNERLHAELLKVQGVVVILPLTHRSAQYDSLLSRQKIRPPVNSGERGGSRCARVPG